MSLPSDIESYLTSDEKMIKTEKSQEWEICVTDRRVLFRKGGVFGKEIVEASYRHISSIEYKKENPLQYIVTGIFLIALAFILPIVLGDYLQDLPPETTCARAEDNRVMSVLLCLRHPKTFTLV